MPRQPDASPLDQDKGQPSGQVSACRHQVDRDETRRLGISARDVAILLTLAHRVRCLDATLAATAWWSEAAKGKNKAARRLQELTRNEWLCTASMFAHALPPLDSPLLVWRQGETPPDFGPIAYHLKNRFLAPAKATAIYWASRKTMQRFGSGKLRRPRASEVSHDLGLAAVYLKLRREVPARAKAWISEAKILARGTARGVKVPDAFIAEKGMVTAIEFGGEYSKTKLVELHRHCERHHEGYELW